jgi:hypothetical protein
MFSPKLMPEHQLTAQQIMSAFQTDGSIRFCGRFSPIAGLIAAGPCDSGG